MQQMMSHFAFNLFRRNSESTMPQTCPLSSYFVVHSLHLCSVSGDTGEKGEKGDKGEDGVGIKGSPGAPGAPGTAI